MQTNYIENFPDPAPDPLALLLAKEAHPDSHTYRAGLLAGMSILTIVCHFVVDSPNPKLAALGVAFALKLTPVNEISQRALAKEMGISHGTISVYASKFNKLLKELTE